MPSAYPADDHSTPQRAKTTVSAHHTKHLPSTHCSYGKKMTHKNQPTVSAHHDGRSSSLQWYTIPKIKRHTERSPCRYPYSGPAGHQFVADARRHSTKKGPVSLSQQMPYQEWKRAKHGADWTDDSELEVVPDTPLPQQHRGRHPRRRPTPLQHPW